PKDLVRGVFGGWLELAVAGLEFVPAEFTLEQAYKALLPLAKRHYPRNKHPEAKIRQQLQRLRDLGVLEFMGRGIYRVIKSPSS
ncbi:MAG: hypothetical protein NZN28_09745, partial [Meiothermus sp.]|uniref:hypothetical protein n=1 Tax=Meiothermus sp. TaxID=1955249 RepID=UPI0025CDA4F8